MKQKRLARGPLLALLVALMASAAADAAPSGGGDARRPGDVAAVTRYLKNRYPGSNWQAGPLALDSEEIRAAYRGRRFYLVRSAPPLPPGAALPEHIARHQRAMEEYASHRYISATVSVDARGRVATVETPRDFNVGLMAVRSDEDARVAAAAIMTLRGLGYLIGPIRIAASDVTVQRTDDGGWSASMERAWLGSQVEFDAAGRCKELPAVPPPPTPPSAPRGPQPGPGF
ncbi:MAG TPA: hypothetical protein VH877_30130 [Polyangia bacterium]|jgi:hypothetical protein|nr:hypothetical protein [Polyangia bacterium]